MACYYDLCNGNCDVSSPENWMDIEVLRATVSEWLPREIAYEEALRDQAKQAWQSSKKPLQGTWQQIIATRELMAANRQQRLADLTELLAKCESLLSESTATA